LFADSKRSDRDILTWVTRLQLKSQQESIEQLVDTVVQGYHSGFNKAIHNYSQILHLFSVSKDQVRSASPPPYPPDQPNVAGVFPQRYAGTLN